MSIYFFKIDNIYFIIIQYYLLLLIYLYIRLPIEPLYFIYIFLRKIY